MRIGVIGLGRMGAVHARNLSADERVDSLVISDLSSELASRIAGELDAEVEASPEDLMGRDLDAVVIASSTPTHPELILAGAKAGLVTFCEKPIALDPRTAVPIMEEVRTLEPRVQIGFPRRFDRGFMRARDAYRSGALGALHTVRVTTMDREPPPADYVRVSGGIFRDTAIHDFDTLRWLTGSEVVAASSFGSAHHVDYIGEAGDIDTAATVLQFDNGTMAVITNTRVNGEGYDIRIELHGTSGSVSAGMGDFTPMPSAEPGVEYPSGPFVQEWTERFAPAYRDELSAFVSFALGEIDSPCTIDDAMAASWISEACDLSRREGRTVTIAEVRGA